MQFFFIGFGLGWLRVEHSQGRGHQQHPAAHLKAGQRDTKKRQDVQPHQGTDGNHHKGAERRYPDGAFALRIGEVMRVMDKKRHDGQRVHNGQQGDEGLEIHGAGLAV